MLEERGPDADLNDIYISDITDLSNLFQGLNPGNIKIDKWDVKNVDSINASNIVTDYGSGVFFSANFTDSYGNPLANEKVVFKFNGKSYDLTTDSNGMAVLYRQLSAGKYDVELVNPASRQSENYTFEILKIPVKLTVKKVVENYGARKYLSIKVVDSKGNAISGIALTVKYNGRSALMMFQSVLQVLNMMFLLQKLLLR